jgi:hypothetical protein
VVAAANALLSGWLPKNVTALLTLGVVPGGEPPGLGVELPASPGVSDLPSWLEGEEATALAAAADGETWTSDKLVALHTALARKVPAEDVNACFAGAGVALAKGATATAYQCRWAAVMARARAGEE